MDIRRLRQMLKEIPPRNSDNAYKYIVVGSKETKDEVMALLPKLTEEERNSVVVVTEEENTSSGMGVRSSGHSGMNRTNGWEASTFAFASENGEIR